MKGRVNDLRLARGRGAGRRWPGCNWRSTSSARRSSPEVVKPAIKFARDGFPISKNLAQRDQEGSTDQFGRDPGSAKLYLQEGRAAARRGPRSATRTSPTMLQSARRQGPGRRLLHRARSRTQIAAAFRKNGGLVTAEDLAALQGGRGQAAHPGVAGAHHSHPAADGRRADRRPGARHPEGTRLGESRLDGPGGGAGPRRGPAASPGTTGCGCSATRSTRTCRSNAAFREECEGAAPSGCGLPSPARKPVEREVGRPAGGRDDPPERGRCRRDDGRPRLSRTGTRSGRR